MYTYDQQQAFSFAVQQASHIEATVYTERLPGIRYPDLIPVDTSAPEWVPTVTYFSMSQAGQAEWLNGAAKDVPRADVAFAKSEEAIELAGIGYGWNIEETGKAQLLGMNLDSSKATAARRAADEMVDRVAFLGDAAKGFTGLANIPGTEGDDADNPWTDPNTDPAAILSEFNGIITGVFESSRTVEMIDTILLPHSVVHTLGTRMVTEYSTETILEWLRRHNVYTMETGRPLTIRGVRGLETAGDAGVGRLIAYRRSPEVLKLHMPMPHRFLPVWQSGPMQFDVPGIMRFGGVNVRLPGAFRYFDNVAPAPAP